MVTCDSSGHRQRHVKANQRDLVAAAEVQLLGARRNFAEPADVALRSGWGACVWLAAGVPVVIVRLARLLIVATVRRDLLVVHRAGVIHLAGRRAVLQHVRQELVGVSGDLVLLQECIRDRLQRLAQHARLHALVDHLEDIAHVIVRVRLGGGLAEYQLAVRMTRVVQALQDRGDLVWTRDAAQRNQVAQENLHVLVVLRATRLAQLDR